MKGLNNMSVTHITVEYPTESVTIVPKTQEQVMREALMFRTPINEVKDHYRIVTKLNEAQTIYVHQVKDLIEDEFKSNDDRCLEQTGMTPSAYQARFKRAWND